MCSVLKVFSALTINTYTDFSYIFLQLTKIPLILLPSNVNSSAKQILAYQKPFSSRSSRSLFLSFLCYSKPGLHLIHNCTAIWLCGVGIVWQMLKSFFRFSANLRENFSINVETIMFTQLCVINQRLHHREHSYSGWCFGSVRFDGVSNKFVSSLQVV
jgi:hypothetical protein